MAWALRVHCCHGCNILNCEISSPRLLNRSLCRSTSLPPFVTSYCPCGSMPTPSDSTDELPLQIEGHTLHTTCPPENDRPSEWRVQVLDRLDRAGSEGAAATVNEAVQQQESMRTPKEESPPTLSTSDSAQIRAGHVSVLDVGQTSSQMFSDCQQSYQAEDKDVQIHIASTPTSSALDVPLSFRLGVDSSRV